MRCLLEAAGALPDNARARGRAATYRTIFALCYGLGSVHSYRDTIRLLLLFVAADKRCKLTRLELSDLTFERVVAFLRHLEHDRYNSISTRNQRVAAVRSLFEYIATRSPEMLVVCQQVAALPANRVPPRAAHFATHCRMRPRSRAIACGDSPASLRRAAWRRKAISSSFVRTSCARST